MKSSDIIKAIKRKHRMKSAFVQEITLDDQYYIQSNMRINEDYAQYFDNRGLLDHDYQVDESYDHRKGKSSRRIDLLMLDSQKWTAIEIKISRSDFYRDTEEKRRAWKTHTHRFIYATPQGLITAEEVPDGCGWWEITPTGQIIVSKRAKVNKERKEFPDSFVRTLFWRLATTR